MVSLDQRQSLAAQSQAEKNLKLFRMLLDGEDMSQFALESRDIRERLLSALSSNDEKKFKTAAAEIEQRKISSTSDWCNDDYLMFLLLLGNEKFNRPLKFLSRVIDCRRANTNPIPRKLNDVFAALDRKEFGLDGELSYLKIPFLHLTGKLRLDGTSARHALKAMTDQPIEPFSPFLQLLALKAHDLVLTERQPTLIESAEQLISAFETHAKQLNVAQWRRIISSLPGRIWIALAGVVVALGLVPILFGIGQKIAVAYSQRETRVIPTEIQIGHVGAGTGDLPSEAASLGRVLLSQSTSAAKHAVLVHVDSVPFEAATRPFVVEVSHPSQPILNAIAFTRSSPNVPVFTVVPVQRDSTRYRALLPRQDKGRIITFLLTLDAGASTNEEMIGKLITLRPLQ